MEAGEFVRTIQHRQALAIACLEENAFRQGWIDHGQRTRLAAEFARTRYGSYLATLAEAEDSPNGSSIAAGHSLWPPWNREA